MRFLKNKIALAEAAKVHNIKRGPLSFTSALELESESRIDTQTNLECIRVEVEYTHVKLEYPQDGTEVSASGSEPSAITNKKTNKCLHKRAPRRQSSNIASDGPRATKNIVKNYAQAIFKFALSYMATDYLLKFTKNEGVSLTDFLNYIKSVKTQTEGLHHFRSVLLITDSDSCEIASYKRVLVQIGKIFIKFFSVNWIYDSKLVHKEAHLKYRLKMLRRIGNPEFFTYLKI